MLAKDGRDGNGVPCPVPPGPFSFLQSVPHSPPSAPQTHFMIGWMDRKMEVEESLGKAVGTLPPGQWWREGKGRGRNSTAKARILFMEWVGKKRKMKK